MAKLYFNYAAMNAGKSTSLLQAAFNYRERGMRVLLVTAAIDRRHGDGVIASRIGLKSQAKAFSAETDLFDLIKNEHRNSPVDCVFVDEAQFLSAGQALQLASAVDELGIPVICYGLRTDFQGKLFPGSQQLFTLADEIRELKTICHCGRKATMNLRVDGAGRPVRVGETIEIGGNERYIPLCRKHFFEKMADAD